MRLFVILGGIAGFLAVALGAFGAHVLKGKLSPEMLTIFETASRYHLIHALALVLVALLVEKAPHWTLTLAGWAFTAGILIFSGTLYLLAVTELRWLGAITPIGGLALLTGWSALVLRGMARN